MKHSEKSFAHRRDSKMENEIRAVHEIAGGKGEIVLLRAVGAEISAASTSRDAESWPFPLGSVSKFVTASAMVKAHMDDTARLDWTLDNVEDCIPRYMGASVRLTIEDVLRHRTGLSVWAFSGEQRRGQHTQLADVLAGRGTEPALCFDYAPGLRTAYSSGAFGLLELELQRRFKEDTNRWLPQVLRGLDPRSTITADMEELPEEASMQVGFLSPAIAVPGGSLIQVALLSQGLWGTAGDLVRLLQRVAQDVRNDGPLALMATRRGHPRMGLSTLVAGEPPDQRLSHQGYVAGFNCQFVSLPWKDVHVVLLSSSPAAGDVLDGLAESALLCVGQEPRKLESKFNYPPASGLTFSGHGVSAYVSGLTAIVTWPAVDQLELQWFGSYFSGLLDGFPRLIPHQGYCVFRDGRVDYRLEETSAIE